MAENQEADAEKHDGVDGAAPTSRPGEAEVSPVRRPDEQRIADSSADRRQHGQDDARSFLRRLTTNERLTLLVGVGSLVISVLTYWNATDTSDLKNAVGNLATLASAAERQAKAALEQVKVAQAALIASESAVVYFGPLTFVPVPQADGIYKTGISATIGNSGGSPTRKLSFSFACKPTDRVIDDPYDRDMLRSAKVYYATLSPKEVKTPIACVYTLAEAALIPLIRANVYVFGVLKYEDTVDRSVMHRVEFCQRLFDVAIGVSFFAMAEDCAGHNCRDEECEAQP